MSNLAGQVLHRKPQPDMHNNFAIRAVKESSLATTMKLFAGNFHVSVLIYRRQEYT